MLSREEKRCRLIGFNPVSQEIIWEIPIDDVLIDAPVIINETIFLTSNRVAQKDKGAPTLYAFDINPINPTIEKKFTPVDLSNPKIKKYSMNI